MGNVFQQLFDRLISVVLFLRGQFYSRSHTQRSFVVQGKVPISFSGYCCSGDSIGFEYLLIISRERSLGMYLW